LGFFALCSQTLPNFLLVGTNKKQKRTKTQRFFCNSQAQIAWFISFYFGCANALAQRVLFQAGCAHGRLLLRLSYLF